MNDLSTAAQWVEQQCRVESWLKALLVIREILRGYVAFILGLTVKPTSPIRELASCGLEVTPQSWIWQSFSLDSLLDRMGMRIRTSQYSQDVSDEDDVMH